WAGEANPHGMQHLLCRASWDADAVRDDVREYVGAELSDLRDSGGSRHSRRDILDQHGGLQVRSWRVRRLEIPSHRGTPGRDPV
ncbi:hypothetical protein ABZS68_39820, partial [Streptomyces sp. NPDC005571]